MVGLKLSADTSSGASTGVLRSRRSRHSAARFLMMGRDVPAVCTQQNAPWWAGGGNHIARLQRRGVGGPRAPLAKCEAQNAG